MHPTTWVEFRRPNSDLDSYLSLAVNKKLRYTVFDDNFGCVSI